MYGFSEYHETQNFWSGFRNWKIELHSVCLQFVFCYVFRVFSTDSASKNYQTPISCCWCEPTVFISVELLWINCLVYHDASSGMCRVQYSTMLVKKVASHYIGMRQWGSEMNAVCLSKDHPCSIEENWAACLAIENASKEKRYLGKIK